MKKSKYERDYRETSKPRDRKKSGHSRHYRTHGRKIGPTFVRPEFARDN